LIVDLPKSGGRRERKRERGGRAKINKKIEN
jgi:hypothetical protein